MTHKPDILIFSQKWSTVWLLSVTISIIFYMWQTQLFEHDFDYQNTINVIRARAVNVFTDNLKEKYLELAVSQISQSDNTSKSVHHIHEMFEIDFPVSHKYEIDIYTVVGNPNEVIFSNEITRPIKSAVQAAVDAIANITQIEYSIASQTINYGQLSQYRPNVVDFSKIQREGQRFLCSSGMTCPEYVYTYSVTDIQDFEWANTEWISNRPPGITASGCHRIAVIIYIPPVTISPLILSEGFSFAEISQSRSDSIVARIDGEGIIAALSPHMIATGDTPSGHILPEYLPGFVELVSQAAKQILMPYHDTDLIENNKLLNFFMKLRAIYALLEHTKFLLASTLHEIEASQADLSVDASVFDNIKQSVERANEATILATQCRLAETEKSCLDESIKIAQDSVRMAQLASTTDVITRRHFIPLEQKLCLYAPLWLPIVVPLVSTSVDWLLHQLKV